MNLRRRPQCGFLIGADKALEARRFGQRKKPTDVGRSARNARHVEGRARAALSRLVTSGECADMKRHGQIDPFRELGRYPQIR